MLTFNISFPSKLTSVSNWRLSKKGSRTHATKTASRWAMSWRGAKKHRRRETPLHMGLHKIRRQSPCSCSKIRGASKPPFQGAEASPSLCRTNNCRPYYQNLADFFPVELNTGCQFRIWSKYCRHRSCRINSYFCRTNSKRSCRPKSVEHLMRPRARGQAWADLGPTPLSGTPRCATSNSPPRPNLRTHLIT